MTGKTNPKKKTILIIDDDIDISHTIKGNLELDDFHVMVADDGKSGIETAKEIKPDLILLDLNLPDIDGITACRVIRRNYDFPIIMLTARDSISDKILGFECGADDYLIKPFNYLELAARIKALLKRSGTDSRSESGVFHTAGLSINFKSRKMMKGEKEITLTKKEFELIELFAHHPNEVLDRNFIQDQIWRDSQLYKHSRALDVHIQRLRKKIESDIENPEYIITIPGVGYKLVLH